MAAFSDAMKRKKCNASRPHRYASGVKLHTVQAIDLTQVSHYEPQIRDWGRPRCGAAGTIEDA
eukprot:354734-Chlamydomonas_euryale.AAC.7